LRIYAINTRLSGNIFSVIGKGEDSFGLEYKKLDNLSINDMLGFLD
jgi:hypothetical protein